jgi:hypothetical protein
LSRTDLSLAKLHAAKNARLDRLSETYRELAEQLENSASSISCGTAYLKMQNELPNLSPNDFMEFFNQCLRINTLFNKQTVDSINTKGEQVTLLESLSRMHARRLPAKYERTLDPMTHNPPEWFQDNKKAWKLFVLSHANFSFYLRPDFEELLVTRSLPVKEMREELDRNFYYGFTKQGEFPDWLLEEDSMLPAKEEVEEELAEDKEQEIKTISAQEKIKEQRDYLTTTSADKARKAVARLSDLVTEAFPNIQNFADMILILEIADKAKSFTTKFEEIIRELTQSYDILKISEPIALYIEKKLLEGKIMQSTQDLIDADFTDLFTIFLESVKDKEGSSADQFRTLKETNKKAFGVLNYDLKPFLEILPADEISLLEDLLAESKNKPIELFIWDMAGFISSRFMREEIQLTRPQLGAFHYLSKLTASFLRNHSKFAYEELQKSLHNLQEQEILKPEDSLVTANLQEEIESTTGEIAQGNLAGWRIFYTDNMQLDPNHLSEIGGKSLLEREETLSKFFNDNGIATSIKTGSIVRAFEWIVGVPQEVEQTRIKKEVGDQMFNKLKRGALRIFYVMDTDKKVLTFFTHQKKAWSYGF